MDNSEERIIEAEDAEFMKILNEVLTEHEEAFRGLVDR